MDAHRARTAAVTIAGLTGVAVTCAVYYPGVMSSDSIYAYRQATAGVVEGATKTPLLAFLWMWIVKIVPGAFGMLLFQNLLFWSGLALIAAACRFGPIVSALAVLAIGLFPTVFGLLGTIWSDVLLAAFLTLFVGVALIGAVRQSRWLLIASLVPLWCGLGARVNAFPAIVPLAAWLLALWTGAAGGRPASMRSRRFVGAWLALLLVLLVTSKLFDRAVIDRGSGSYTRSLQFSLLHDLAGMAVHSGDLRLPPRVYLAIPNMSLDLIRRVYDPADVNLLVYNKDWDSSAFLTKDPAEFSALVRLWAGAIAAHPDAYLQRRAEAMAAMLQIRGMYYPFHTGIDANDLGLTFTPRPAYERLTEWLHRYQGVFFRGWAFAVVAVAVVGVGMRRRRWSAVAVCASGLLYVAPITVITTGSDFRYIWWLVVSALVGVLLLAGDQTTQRSPQTTGVD